MAKKTRKVARKQDIALISDIHGNGAALNMTLESIADNQRDEIREELYREVMSQKEYQGYSLDQIREQAKTNPEFGKWATDEVTRRAKENPVKIVSLGDNVGEFYDVFEVMSQVMKFSRCIMGNHEEYLKFAIDGMPATSLNSFFGVNPGPAIAMERTARILNEAKEGNEGKEKAEKAEEIIEFIKSLPEDPMPISDDMPGIIILHGPRGEDGKMKYPLTHEMAEKYGITPEAYNDACMGPEKIFDNEDIFKPGVYVALAGHDHIQGMIARCRGGAVEQWNPTYKHNPRLIKPEYMGSYDPFAVDKNKGLEFLLGKVGSTGGPRLISEDEANLITSMSKKIVADAKQADREIGYSEIWPSHYMVLKASGKLVFRRTYYDVGRSLKSKEEAERRIQVEWPTE